MPKRQREADERRLGGVPYLYKKVKTKHVDFVTRTKCFCYKSENEKNKRSPRRAPTGESKQERNKRAAYLRRKYAIYENFDKGDMWVTLTYRPGKELTDEEAHKTMMEVLGKVRKKLQRKGIPFVYFVKTESGKRVRVHHHLFIRKNFDVISVLFEYWKDFGNVKDFKEIYDLASGRLVKYFLDGGDHKEIGYEKYSHSRNLREPEVETRVYPFRSFRAVPREPKEEDGIRFVIQNLYNGFPDLDGFIYQEYEILKIRDRE